MPPTLTGESGDFWVAVRALPRRQAQAVALFYLEDRPSGEIAVILGCSEATVRAHLHQARATLRVRLGAGDHDEESR